jgi:hypothetical protein
MYLKNGTKPALKIAWNAARHSWRYFCENILTKKFHKHMCYLGILSKNVTNKICDTIRLENSKDL